MLLPSSLRPGNKIGIVAPSRKIGVAEIEAAEDTFRSWGLEPVLSPNLFSRAHSYLAGTDVERLADLQQMIDDPDIRAIVCARGGYGSTRILEQLNCVPLLVNPKWLVGFSDITALHLKLLANGIASVHGTMPILFSKTESASSIESLQRVLIEGTCEIETHSYRLNLPGETQGEVIGGNLSLIVDSLGTSSEINTDSKILIIEEVDEYLYKVDRMMTQLKRAGKFEHLKGLIIGHMTEIKDTTLSFGETVEEIILNSVGKNDIPLAFKFPTGHENPNLAWIQGGYALFKVDANGVSLSFDGSSE
jgi:muramoyltetrapeptide carboxypeptidase